MRLFPLLCVVLVACGQTPGTLLPEPLAEPAPPVTTATPPPGPFNGERTVTLSTDFPATIYVSTDGSDPREGGAGRQSGPSPFTITLTRTTTLRYFASERGRDEALQQGEWVRAGGPVGTISGVVVVGRFVVGKQVGLFNNAGLTPLGTPTAPVELPFFFEGQGSGTYRLSALADRNGDGQLTPVLDYASATTTVTLDLTDPFQASAEGLRINLGASGTGLGTLSGTITLPKPPPAQALRLSVLSPDLLGAGLDPQALLTQLQSGYGLVTNQTDTAYPYVVTDLQPGQVVPVPSLIGASLGGLAVNLVANPLRTVTIVADRETRADFSFGPVGMSGAVVVPGSTATGPLVLGVVAARAFSLTEGVQALLVPLLLTRDVSTQTLRGRYAGSALRANAPVALRVFTNGNGANPLTDALTWVVNPLGSPGQVTVTTGQVDVVQDLIVP